MVWGSPFRVEDINQKWNAMESNMVEEQEIVSDKRKRFDNYYPQQPEYRQGMKQNQGLKKNGEKIRSHLNLTIFLTK